MKNVDSANGRNLPSPPPNISSNPYLPVRQHDQDRAPPPSYASSSGTAGEGLSSPITNEELARSKREDVSAAGSSVPLSNEELARFKRDGGSASPDGGPEAADPAVAAAVIAEVDGTIGVEIDVRHNSRFLQGMSEMGVRKGEARGGSQEASSSSGLGRDGPGDKDQKDAEDGPNGAANGQTRNAVQARLPPMSIVIFIVGSRGDVQPYIALALALITQAGHRVRIATHSDFQALVLGANSRLRGKTHEGVALEGNLEFFDAGGDPKELMAYMVKNPGLLPGMESLTNGDIKRKRKMAAEYLRGFYRSTFSPDVVSGRDFAADAIISNPPAFAHIHVAEALGIPLHMSFTMPWTATTSFPHPLVNVKKSNADQWATNWIGYHLTDMLMWQGLGDTINEFRTSILRLTPLWSRIAPGLLDTLQISWTYCWSPELLPKPSDWRSNIDISGFYFLDGEDNFVPPAPLAAFLAQGEAPVYIGFGSVVIPAPKAVTDMIFEAVENAGVRAIVSAGWAGLGKGREGDNPNIFIMDQDCSHEWLFANKRVAAVCHHGGAGTTSCGLRHGRPTIIVPFFGDQKFWGDAVHNAGAGPKPIPIKSLSVDALSAALREAISPGAVAAAAVLGSKIRAEKGEDRGVESFTRNMPVDDLCCDVDPRRVAVWWCPSLALKLSVEAASALISAHKIGFRDLEPYRSKEYDTAKHGHGAVGGMFGGIGAALATTFSSTSQLFYSPGRGVVNTFYGIPEAAVGIVADMYDGFDNLSTKMGSTPRRKGKVTDWRSGFQEGGKALGWGLWDGITGLVTEPVDGALREGPVGFGKGVVRGFSNLLNRPIAGSLGLFVLPMRGIRASVRSTFGQQHPHSVLRGPREALTRQTMLDLSPDAKDRLLRTFARLEGESKERRKNLSKTKWVLIADKKEREAERLEREREGVEKRQRSERNRAQGQREKREKEERKQIRRDEEEIRKREREEAKRGKGKGRANQEY